MNKIIILALCAFAAVASAAPTEVKDDFSQLMLATTDSAETSGLVGPMQVYAPFCTQSRDFVFTDIEHNTNAAASNAFAMLMNMVETIGKAAVGTVGFGSSVLTPVIANPNAVPIDSSAELADEVQARIRDGANAVASAQTQPRSFVEAFKSIVSATSTAVARAYSDKISQLKEVVATFGSISTLEALCDKAGEYEHEINAMFEQYKAKVAAENSDFAQAELTLNRVPCTTSTRVVRLNSICEFARSSAPSVSKLIATRGQKQQA